MRYTSFFYIKNNLKPPYSITLLLVGSMLFSSNLWANLQYSQKNKKNQTYNTKTIPVFNQQVALEYAFISEFQAQSHQIDDALNYYTPLALYTKSTNAKRRALELSLENNKLNNAFIIADAWVKQEPDDVPALFYLAHTSLKTQHYTQFSQVLEKILKIDENANLNQILTGIIPEEKSDRLQLLDNLKTIKYQNNPSLLALIATIEAYEQQFKSALTNINKALRKKPDSTSFILLKANLLIAINQQDKALDWLKKMSHRYKYNVDIHLAEIKLLIEQHQEKLALKCIEQALKYNPQAENILFLASLIYIDQQAFKKAEDYLLRLQNSDQYHNDANYYLGINAERQQHFEDALLYYRQVDGNLYIASRQAIIKIYQKLKQYNEAIRFLTQERVNYPSYASFLYQTQATLLQSLNQNTQALALLQEASQDIPDDPDLLYAQILLLDPHQDQKKLDQVLEHLLQLEPNNPNYLNAYAYTLALQNRNLKRARAYAEQALEQDPTQASFLDTLGYIAFLQNDFDTAIHSLEMAYHYNPSASIGIKYANALYMKGDLNRFKNLIQELKQHYPNDEQILQLDLLILPDDIST